LKAEFFGDKISSGNVIKKLNSIGANNPWVILADWLIEDRQQSKLEAQAPK
jgi:hypothetical protein